MIQRRPVARFSDWIEAKLELMEMMDQPMPLGLDDITDMRDELLEFEKSMAVAFAYEVLSKLGNIKDANPLEVGPLQIMEMYDIFFEAQKPL